MNLRIAGTVNDSIVDGPGLRFVIFVQGCPHNCPGCHNPQTHDFKGGRIVSTDELLQRIKNNPLLDGVTFSGGEPFCQAIALAHLGKQIKELGLDIWTYTGYHHEHLKIVRKIMSNTGVGDLLDITDVLVDGPFIQDLKTTTPFIGSSNQRIINLGGHK